MACAPTGSGKTVLFELAIVRLLLETSEPWKDVKAVYSKEIKKYLYNSVSFLCTCYCNSNSLIGVSQLKYSSLILHRLIQYVGVKLN